MWFLRRMLRIPWKEAETNRSLMQKKRKQQATFFGHVMRREGLEHFLTTGKLNRKRSKGRKTKRKNAGQPEVLVGYWKSDGYDVSSSRPQRLERHDRQRHEARHLMDGSTNQGKVCTQQIPDTL